MLSISWPVYFMKGQDHFTTKVTSITVPLAALLYALINLDSGGGKLMQPAASHSFTICFLYKILH